MPLHKQKWSNMNGTEIFSSKVGYAWTVRACDRFYTEKVFRELELNCFTILRNCFSVLSAL